MGEPLDRGETETENISDDEEEEMVEAKKEKERRGTERTEAAEQRRAERAVDQEGEHILLAISYKYALFYLASDSFNQLNNFERLSSQLANFLCLGHTVF